MTVGLYLTAAAVLLPVLVLIMGSLIVAGEADDRMARWSVESTGDKPQKSA